VEWCLKIARVRCDEYIPVRECSEAGTREIYAHDSEVIARIDKAREQLFRKAVLGVGDSRR
jgi:hypothetical protein